MSNDQLVPVRKVIPYKSGKRPETTRRLNIDFAGTALEQAIADRDAIATVTSSQSSIAEEAIPSQEVDNKEVERLSESLSTSLSPSETEPVSESVSLSMSTSASRPVSISETVSVSEPDSLSHTQSRSRPVPLSTSVSRSLSASESQPTNQVLDATHSGSEQRVYSQMYRETISKGKQQGYFPIPELKRLTGIRSTNTIRRALIGLIEKQSIRLLEKNQGSHYGSHYRIFGPKEILSNRKKAGIAIDERTKRIIITSRSLSLSGSMSDSEMNSSSVSYSRSATESDYDDSQNMTVSDEHVYINNINPIGNTKSSSGPDQKKSDDEKYNRTLNWFEQLSNGGSWKPERDDTAYDEITHCNQWHILLGLCYSVSRSPEHKMSSLKYAVPAILNHYRDMAEFPDNILAEIAYKTKMKTLNCLATGNWTVAEWDIGRE